MASISASSSGSRSGSSSGTSATSAGSACSAAAAGAASSGSGITIAGMPSTVGATSYSSRRRSGSGSGSGCGRLRLLGGRLVQADGRHAQDRRRNGRVVLRRRLGRGVVLGVGEGVGLRALVRLAAHGRHAAERDPAAVVGLGLGRRLGLLGDGRTARPAEVPAGHQLGPAPAARLDLRHVPPGLARPGRAGRAGCYRRYAASAKREHRAPRPHGEGDGADGDGGRASA